MKRNNTGCATGFTLLLALVVALLVAWLAVTQLGAIMRRPQDGGAVQPTEDLVQQAQEAVDALNERMGHP